MKDRQDLIRIKDELIEGLNRDLIKFINYAVENQIDIDGIDLRLVCERWAESVTPFDKRKYRKQKELVDTILTYLP